MIKMSKINKKPQKMKKLTPSYAPYATFSYSKFSSANLVLSAESFAESWLCYRLKLIF